MIILRQKQYSVNPVFRGVKDIADTITDPRFYPYMAKNLANDNINGAKNFIHDLKWATKFDPKNKRQMELMSALYFNKDKKAVKDQYKQSKQNLGRTAGKIITQIASLGTVDSDAVDSGLSAIDNLSDLPDLPNGVDLETLNQASEAAKKANELTEHAHSAGEIAAKATKVANSVVGTNKKKLDAIQEAVTSSTDEERLKGHIRNRLNPVSQLAYLMKLGKTAGVGSSGSETTGKGAHEIGISVPNMIEDAANFNLIKRYGKMFTPKVKAIINGEEDEVHRDLTMDDFNDENLLKLCKDHEEKVIDRASRVPSIRKKYENMKNNPAMKLMDRAGSWGDAAVKASGPILKYIPKATGALAEGVATPFLYAYKKGAAVGKAGKKYGKKFMKNPKLEAWYLLNPDDEYHRERTARLFNSKKKKWADIVKEDRERGEDFTSNYRKDESGHWVYDPKPNN